MAASRNTVGAAQGWLYVISGLWPVVHIRSFVWVTGPKRDLWLVKTVGALLAVIGAALVRSGQSQEGAPGGELLGAGTAATLAAVDVVYWRRGILRWVYLVDAALELGIVAAWLAARRP